MQWISEKLSLKYLTFKVSTWSNIWKIVTKNIWHFNVSTLPRKNMNLPYSIRMYWANIWQPTVNAQQSVFEKNLIEVGSSHLYASFGTFQVQIDQLVEAQLDFKLSEVFEIDVNFLRKQRFYRLLAPFALKLVNYVRHSKSLK